MRLPHPLRSAARRLNRSGLPAGLADSIPSSIATLAVGLFAMRYLDDEGLGLYAVAFSAFAFASMLSTQAVFVPAEVANLDVPEANRVALLRSSLLKGMPFTIAAAALAALLVLLVPSRVPLHSKVVFVLTLFVTTAASPLQDHARRVFHQARRSWTAAAISLVQVATVVVVLAIGLGLGGSGYAMPFGALGVANVISLGVAWVLASSAGSGAPFKPFQLFVSGRWLLVAGSFQFGAGLVTVVLVSTFAGAVYAGRGEAIRVMSQPLFVVAAGLGAVLGPRAMEAARTRNRATSVLHTRVFTVCLLGGTILYALAIGPPWPWNFLDSSFSPAYADRTLLLLLIAMTGLGYSLTIQNAQLIGGGREARLAGIMAVSSVIQVAVVAATLTFGTYALFFGLAAATVVRAVAFRVTLRRHYAETTTETKPAPVPEIPTSGFAPMVASPVPDLGR